MKIVNGKPFFKNYIKKLLGKLSFINDFMWQFLKIVL